MEHVTCCNFWLSVFAYLPLASEDITITTDNLLCIRVPNNQLSATILHRIELIDIHRFARTTSCRTESYLAQTTNLLHNIRSSLSSHNINFIVTLVSHTKHPFRSQLALEQFLAYGLDDFFFHIFYQSFSFSKSNRLVCPFVLSFNEAEILQLINHIFNILRPFHRCTALIKCLPRDWLSYRNTECFTHIFVHLVNKK